MPLLRRAFVMALVAALVFTGEAVAQAQLGRPSGRALLRIAGKIARPNVGPAAMLDRALLEGLPARRLRTTTPWTEGEQLFEGVALVDLLAAVGASGKTVKAIALNDYAATIPIDDPLAAEALIAYRRNGEAMRIRDKGPLWIVFPWRDRPEMWSKQVKSWAVWQLKALEVD